MQDVVIVDFGGGDSFGLPYNARVPSVGETIRLWFDESLFVGRFNDSHGWELMKRLDGKSWTVLSVVTDYRHLASGHMTTVVCVHVTKS